MTIDDIARTLGVDGLSTAELDALLDLARDVAHATERKNAPLTCFLVGLVAADAPDRSTAVAELAARIRTGLV